MSEEEDRRRHAEWMRQTFPALSEVNVIPYKGSEMQAHHRAVDLRERIEAEAKARLEAARQEEAAKQAAAMAAREKARLERQQIKAAETERMVEIYKCLDMKLARRRRHRDSIVKPTVSKADWLAHSENAHTPEDEWRAIQEGR